MENASKAILIAGTVLCVLLVVTIVIIFFNKGQEATEYISNNTEERYVQIHNSQFNIYEGTNRTKSEIEKLVSVVNKNNSRDKAYKVSITGTDVDHNAATDKYTFNGTNYVSGSIKYYTVRLKIDGEGLIYSITVI